MKELKKNINNANIIQGLLKEALFLDLDLSYNQEEVSGYGKVIELDTNNSTDILIFMNDTQHLNIEKNINITFFFKNFLLTFQSKIVQCSHPFIIIKNATNVDLVNLRHQKRINIPSNIQIENRVLLKNDDNIFKCRLKVLDISINGLGGLLTCSSKNVVDTNSKLEGLIFFKGQWLTIKGKNKVNN